MRKVLGVIIVLAAGSLLSAQQVRRGVGVVPASSIERPEDIGVRAHTHYYIYAPDGVIRPSANPGGETPASLGCVYGLVSSPKTGCPIATSSSLPTGGSEVIVIVDAYNYSSASSDLKAFASEFGLPTPNFSVQYANGKPSDGCSNGWAGEESLDIDMAFAMAPKAEIVLMEAKSNSFTDLYAAVTAANSYIASHGGKGEVSMSWGGSESSGEGVDDGFFLESDVVYFASTGDATGTEYPSVSPNVVAVGATQINRDSGGNYTNQTGSKDCNPSNNGCGGGKSKYEGRPSYQSGVSSVVGSARGVPDIAADGASVSAVAVYNSACYGGWVEFYGTSVASPLVAGIVNSAGSFKSSTNSELTEVYNNRKVTADFTDITSGSCGSNSGKSGYDLCTGVGVDKGKKGK
jgi:kumamolisin